MPPRRTGANTVELGSGGRPSSSTSSPAAASSSRDAATPANSAQHSNTMKRSWSAMSGSHDQRNHEDHRHRTSPIHHHHDDSSRPASRPRPSLVCATDGPRPASRPRPSLVCATDGPRPSRAPSPRPKPATSKAQAQMKSKAKAASSKGKGKSKSKPQKTTPVQKEEAKAEKKPAPVPQSDAKLVRLHAGPTGWHVVGRSSYEDMLREAGSILGVPPAQVRLVLRQPPAAPCEIRPSAWNAIPVEAAVYANVHKTNKQADDKSFDGVPSPGVVAHQIAGPSSVVIGPQSIPSNQASTQDFRSSLEDFRQSLTRKSPSHNDARLAGLQHWWAMDRNITSAAWAKRQLSWLYNHALSLENCKCQEPDQEAHLRFSRRLRKAEQWYKTQLLRFESDPHYVAHYSLAAIGDEDDQQIIANAARVVQRHAEARSSQRGPGLVNPSPVQIYRNQVSTKRSRFSTETRPCPQRDGVVEEQDEHLRRQLAVVSISSGSSSETTTSGSSCSSDSSSASSSSLSPSSASPVPVLAPRPRSCPKAPIVRKREWEEEEVEFELVSVRAPAPPCPKRTRRVHTPPAHRLQPGQNDSEMSQDELISSDEEDRGSRHTSITTCPTGDEADDEQGTASDWSEVSRLPKQSSRLKWLPKEQSLYVSKLQEETADLTRRLTGEERAEFFNDFARKHGVLLRSRSAGALIARLRWMLNASSAVGKELPPQLMFLLGQRASTSVGAGGSGGGRLTTVDPSARKRARA